MKKGLPNFLQLDTMQSPVNADVGVSSSTKGQKNLFPRCRLEPHAPPTANFQQTSAEAVMARKWLNPLRRTLPNQYAGV